MCYPTFSSWVFGGAVSPPAGSGAEPPEANAFWQQSIENWLKIRSPCRRLLNYSNFLENMISSSMYDTTSSGLLIGVLWSIDLICSSPLYGGGMIVQATPRASVVGGMHPPHPPISYVSIHMETGQISTVRTAGENNKIVSK